MNAKAKLKRWVYGSCPGLSGSFPYFGTRVHFPSGSHIFDVVCEDGVFEQENLDILCRYIRPNSTFLDIGANIGLMSAPILRSFPTCSVVSVEPSQNVLPFLRRTVENSGWGERWKIVPKAVGAEVGVSEFVLSDSSAAVFDGFRSTGRSETVRKIEVPVTTVDTLWQELGRPEISVIKCDVEGAEAGVLAGAQECLATVRPAVMLEWNETNLAAYGTKPEELLAAADRIGYRVFSLPDLIPVTDKATVRVHSKVREMFLLIPADL